MDKLQQQVQQAIDQLVESGTERGVQVAVYRDGEQVVDAVAGIADPATGRPVDAGAVFYNFSSSRARPQPWPTSWPSVACSATTRRSPSCGPSSPPTASRP